MREAGPMGWADELGKLMSSLKRVAAPPFFPLSAALDPKLYEGRVQVCFYPSLYP